MQYNMMLSRDEQVKRRKEVYRDIQDLLDSGSYDTKQKAFRDIAKKYGYSDGNSVSVLYYTERRRSNPNWELSKTIGVKLPALERFLMEEGFITKDDQNNIYFDKSLVKDGYVSGGKWTEKGTHYISNLCVI